MPKPKQDSLFGRWRLVEVLGTGGSSVVWRAADAIGRIGAIKFLKGDYVTNVSRYQRFVNEVAAMRACANIQGVLPLWDAETPANPARMGDAWLVSPLAKPLSEWQGTLDEAVGICAALATTLAQMHERGFAHRDIKPQNIFFWNDRWCLGDFGIAAGPELSRQTREGEKLGPVHYIAPEMLNQATQSDGRPADVYSLAKLLWKLATGQHYPLPGLQPRDNPALNVSGSVADTRAHALDALIEAATQPEPQRRPTMADVARALNRWFDPIPQPTGPLDLAPFRDRAASLVHPFQSEEDRRDRIQREAQLEIERFFFPFRSVLGEIFTQLQVNRIGESHMNELEGGNAHFCSDCTQERDSFFEMSVIAVLRGKYKRASVMGGLNLGLRNMNDVEGPVPDIYASVLGAAGYVLETHVFDGNKWCSTSSPLSIVKDEFLLGSPDSLAATAQLKAALIDNLSASVDRLLRAFDHL